MGKDLASKNNCCASNLARSMLQFHGYPAKRVVPSLNETPASYELGDGPNLVFKLGGCGFTHPRLISPSVELSSSSASKEDSDEIDALLYSDSEEDASTGHSPTEEVASSLAVTGKRKRIDESNLSMVDTASSCGAYYQSMVCGYAEEADESSCEGGEGQCEEEDEVGENKRVKRERMQETVELLRRIIPGSHGKDAAAVIDDAISYLESLRLQVATTIM